MLFLEYQNFVYIEESIRSQNKILNFYTNFKSLTVLFLRFYFYFRILQNRILQLLFFYKKTLYCIREFSGFDEVLFLAVHLNLLLSSNSIQIFVLAFSRARIYNNNHCFSGINMATVNQFYSNSPKSKSGSENQSLPSEQQFWSNQPDLIDLTYCVTSCTFKMFLGNKVYVLHI